MYDRRTLTDAQINRELLNTVLTTPVWWLVLMACLGVVLAGALSAAGFLINQGLGVTGHLIGESGGAERVGRNDVGARVAVVLMDGAYNVGGQIQCRSRPQWQRRAHAPACQLRSQGTIEQERARVGEKIPARIHVSERHGI